MDDLQHLYDVFYRIPRCGQLELSDGGGPFGFDITMAIEVDYLFRSYKCDAFLETGCHFGDTTEYLARLYPTTPIVSCDCDGALAAFTSHRLRPSKNVEILHRDSRQVIQDYQDRYSCPFFYLDAHWYSEWPLEGELELIKRGIVCVHDFDIGHSRFGFDSYEGVNCGPDVVSLFHDRFPVYFINRWDASYPLPCLQTQRRSGRAYLLAGFGMDEALACPYLEQRAASLRNG